VPHCALSICNGPGPSTCDRCLEGYGRMPSYSWQNFLASDLFSAAATSYGVLRALLIQGPRFVGLGSSCALLLLHISVRQAEHAVSRYLSQVPLPPTQVHGSALPDMHGRNVRHDGLHAGCDRVSRVPAAVALHGHGMLVAGRRLLRAVREGVLGKHVLAVRCGVLLVRRPLPAMPRHPQLPHRPRLLDVGWLVVPVVQEGLRRYVARCAGGRACAWIIWGLVPLCLKLARPSLF
jgi:hypothetical protein